MNKETSYAQTYRPDTSTPYCVIEDRLLVDCFLTTVRCSSFKQAARSLNLQPALLRRKLEVLEDNLGVSLLLYRDNQLILTQAGRDLHQQLRTRLKECSDVGDNRRPLRIGIDDTLLHDMLVRTLITFTRENARRCLEIIPLQSARCLPHQELDLALWTTSPGAQIPQPRHCLQPLDPPVIIRYLPFVATRYAREAARPLSLARLDDFRLIQLEQYQDSAAFAPWNHLIDRRRSGVTYIRAPGLAFHMIKGGAGIGLLPNYIRHLDRTLLPMPDLFDEPMQQQVLLSVHADNQSDADVSCLANYINLLFAERRDWLA
ncbi:LysR family transcriptional regulator [Pseudomonas rubra]|uniref:LysR family transcriptional regulator n=1 Tax=Pseudomonas rubra TaxID=2942627 RepID=A0ABT5PED6_9PSED|nr:LysR family transcriptional regulator [Pseudomonas rubra]MDD1016670.1 LysR family transcriptional regulator [Pseudomonas rubra]MDD1040988.1 LysR family transcriptional regulator [Pseudomonas rubra]MDD1153544.1 LysR family transcriptional regulator [Pseudomonas rubra]